MVIARLVQAGRLVLVPFGENQRYDLVIEDDGQFTRVQCKTGRLRAGAIRFPTVSSTCHHPNNQGMRFYQHGYRGQADLFGVYCPDNDRVYLVPVSDVGTRSGALRIDPPLNNQAKRIRWAREYELRLPG